MGVTWRKSSRSTSNGGNCVEVGWNNWRKSSYSGGHGGECVEVADQRAYVAVRDTQHREHGHLSFRSSEWSSLLSTLKR